MDPFGEDEYADARPVVGAPRWQVFIAGITAAMCLVMAALGSAAVSLAGYLVALVVGTGLVTWHRWADGRASRNAAYLPRPGIRRLALLVALLVVIACAANAVVWATEVSKL